MPFDHLSAKIQKKNMHCETELKMYNTNKTTRNLFTIYYIRFNKFIVIIF